MTSDYQHAFAEELDRLEYPWIGDEYWGDPIQFWEKMVERCQRGYYGPYPEYEYELQVRDVIEGLLVSEKLKEFSQHSELVSRVLDADAKFRDILVVNWYFADQPWWRAGLPNRGGKLFWDSIPDYMKEKVRLV